MKDINYWLRYHAEIGREGFLWRCIEDTMGLRCGTNDKYLLIWELQGKEFANWANLWRTTRHVFYRYFSNETKLLKGLEVADNKVYSRYGKFNKVI